MNKLNRSDTIKKKALERSLEARAKKTAQQKQIFIENYRHYKGIITVAAQKTNINTSTFYDWIKKDEKFRNTILEIEKEVIGEVKDLLLQKVFVEKDLTAIIFYLKNKHPEFQQDKIKLEGASIGNTNYVLIMVKPGEPLPRELQEAGIIDVK